MLSQRTFIQAKRFQLVYTQLWTVIRRSLSHDNLHSYKLGYVTRVVAAKPNVCITATPELVNDFVAFVEKVAKMDGMVPTTS